MEPKIIQKSAMTVIGLQCRTTMKNNQIPQLWERFFPRHGEIRHAIHPQTMLGVCWYEKNEAQEMNENTEFLYLAGLEVDSTADIPQDMVIRDIPAITYAVFTHIGSLETLGQTYNYIYSEWARTSPHKIAQDADQLEVYDERFNFGMPDSEMDIYVPIQTA